MTKTKYYCDICGKEFRKEELSSCKLLFHEVELMGLYEYIPRTSLRWHTVDICNSCLWDSTNLRCGIDGANKTIVKEVQ